MYGRNNELIMEPPHIVLSVKYPFQKGSITKDSWQIDEIKNNKLGKKMPYWKKNSGKAYYKKVKKGLKNEMIHVEINRIDNYILGLEVK